MNTAKTVEDSVKYPYTGTLAPKRVVQTLTIDDTLSLFRSYGVPMSYDTLVAWIDGGAVSWATSARKGGSGPWQRKIWRKPLEAWLDSMSEEVV